MSEADGTSLIEENKEMLLTILENLDDKPKEDVKKEIVDCLSHYKATQEPSVVATAIHDNPAACYDFVRLDKPKDKNYNEVVDGLKMDYNIPRDEEAKNRGFQEDLPISFLSIQDGEVEKGKMWYMNRFPKLPPEMADLLARYNWGDLKYQTKKKIKNDKKKALKKGKKYEPLAFSVKTGKFRVEFD